jgi:hypothetical protein
VDAFTRNHLETWANHVLRDDERDGIVSRMASFVLRHPVVLSRGDSWPEIKRLADRENAGSVSDQYPLSY